MSDFPQQPSGGEPEDRRRGQDIPSEIERERRGNQRGQRGTQRGSSQDEELRGTQRGSSQDEELRGTQRGSSQDEELRGTQRGSYQEQPGQRVTRPVPEPARGSHPVVRETHAEPHRSHRGLYALLGIVGLLMVGGLIGGLVAAFGGSSTTTHPAALRPAHHFSAPSASHLIQQFQNVGPNNSANFKVSSSPVTSRYTYRCPSGASTFSAQMFNTSGTDEQTIANTSGTGGTSSTVLHPKAGGVYHVWANTTCEYRIQVYGK